VPKTNNVFELNELLNVANSAGVRNLLREHKESLQKEVNLLLAKQEFTKAYGELCKLNDVDKIMSLVANRIAELQPKKEA
jgi:hypothetical protein